MIRLLFITMALSLLPGAALADCPEGPSRPRGLEEEPRSALERNSGWPDGDPSAAEIYLDSPAACFEFEVPTPDLRMQPAWEPPPLPGTFRGTVLDSWKSYNP